MTPTEHLGTLRRINDCGNLVIEALGGIGVAQELTKLALNNRQEVAYQKVAGKESVLDDFGLLFNQFLKLSSHYPYSPSMREDNIRTVDLALDLMGPDADLKEHAEYWPTYSPQHRDYMMLEWSTAMATAMMLPQNPVFMGFREKFPNSAEAHAICNTSSFRENEDPSSLIYFSKAFGIATQTSEIFGQQNFSSSDPSGTIENPFYRTLSILFHETRHAQQNYRKAHRASLPHFAEDIALEDFCNIRKLDRHHPRYAFAWIVYKTAGLEGLSPWEMDARSVQALFTRQLSQRLGINYGPSQQYPLYHGFLKEHSLADPETPSVAIDNRG